MIDSAVVQVVIMLFYVWSVTRGLPAFVIPQILVETVALTSPQRVLSALHRMTKRRVSFK